ncbi:non-histone protein 10-like [Pollicipes pollicipes]|uniref:non-histone protein 10-like n=1 Tax=Pollicipes pollicipes TaxID=41117 RepID=UPI0018857DA9|nr:non-histone protein 10-like [Pollicipes pollicipes]XP_037074253.1 non-histone protein 10-like [Pollicipes pollicipes]
MDEESSSSEEDVSSMVLSDPYHRKYAALKRRCQIVKQENRRLVSRVYHVQRLVRRCRRECRLVTDRLDQHGDDYRAAALRAPAPAPPPPERADEPSEPNPKARLKAEKKAKKKLNEPKKPSNPFFQYCQEQRSQLLSQMKNSGGLSKQGLTKQLAANWSLMSSDEKQIYVDRYERDKRQYTLVMQSHRKARSRPAGGRALLRWGR